MRSVSYVQRVALEFSGSLFPHAICLGDVDNDTVGASSIYFASLTVLCSVFPGKKPWLKYTHHSTPPGSQPPLCCGGEDTL
uniref:Uncharacterized protein n=1 Tax=Sus scrofa TaxID=9823 RepID=A0A8D1KKJ8_PIG